MSKTFTTGLAAIAACALFACAGGEDVVDTSTASEATEPTTPLSDDDGRDDGPRTADGREQLESANGATARAISFNHPQPHGLLIPALDLSSGRLHNYQLSLGGGALGERHTHGITLTADQLSVIGDGGEVTVESGVGGSKGAHTHAVTISRR